MAVRIGVGNPSPDLHTGADLGIARVVPEPHLERRRQRRLVSDRECPLTLEDVSERRPRIFRHVRSRLGG